MNRTGISWRMLNAIAAAGLLLVSIVIPWGLWRDPISVEAQNPTLMQGRDYTNNVNRLVSVNSKGELNVNGGGGSGCSAPCEVIGPDSAGSPPTQAPVLTAGWDGVNVQRILTNTNGVPMAIGPTTSGSVIAAASNPLVMGLASSGGRARFLFSPDAVANTADAGNQSALTSPQVFNGSNYDKVFRCGTQSAISFSSTASTRIIDGSAIVRVCFLEFLLDSPTTIEIKRGTGTICGTGTATIAGPYPSNAQGLSDLYTEMSALSTTSTGEDVCLFFGASVTGGGYVKYADY